LLKVQPSPLLFIRYFKIIWFMKNSFSFSAFLIFIFLLFFPFNVNADNLNNFGDYAIAGTVKNLAKAYVQTADLDKLKAKHIKSLLRISEPKFQRHYAEVYDVLKDIPLPLRTEYGLKRSMTKEETIRIIRQIDKKTLFKIIDVVPDDVIVKEVKNYLHQAYQVNSQNAIEQIDSLWKKVLKKA